MQLQGRKNNGYFYKQCHLRNDIGTDGSHHLIDQVTTTTPFGRKPEVHGYPINVCELLSTLEGAVYVERVSVHDIKNIMNAKKAIKKAFKVQMANLGFSIVEVLSSCPTNWGLSPVEALKWIEEKMIPVYPLGNYKGKDLEV